MKRFILGAGFMLLTTACGPYTNVPAQINVKSIEPSSVTVTYKTENSVLVSSYTNPTLTFEGEPGSVGAVFTRAVISYYYYDAKSVKTAPTSVTAQDLDIHIDINTSNYRDPTDTKKIILGTGAWLVPLINRQIIDFGSSRSNAAAVLNADVALEGRDDAWFPIYRHITIPINFTGDLQ